MTFSIVVYNKYISQKDLLVRVSRGALCARQENLMKPRLGKESLKTTVNQTNLNQRAIFPVQSFDIFTFLHLK